tara:strand:+ start:715 stop:882 length:168 start_codon:yes stop_codon:yes gene_type:complete
MELISLLSRDVDISDSSEKIINVLAIGFVTLFVLLILNVIKGYQLKSKIKRLENK